MLSEEVKQLPAAAALLARDPDAVVGGFYRLGELSLEVDPARISNVCRFLKYDYGFNRLSAVTCVDWYPAEPRFEVVYHLHSITKNERVRIKCRIGGERPEIDSVCDIWRGANWYEREVFDLFGVTFRNHPKLTRIMMPEGWTGHPLRKDFPVHGHKYSYQDE